MQRKLTLALVIFSLSVPTFIVSSGMAVETTTNKVKDDFSDAKTSTKKMARNGKQQVRKTTGNDTVLKDAKDKVNNAGDDISNTASKAKRNATTN